MTTLSQPLPRAITSAGNMLNRPAFVAFAVTLLGAFLLLAFVAGTYAQLHRDAIFPGITVAGVPIGGLDAEAAERQLRGGLPALDAGHLTVRFGAVEERVPYAAIGRDYDVEAMFANAFAIGRSGSPFEQAAEQLRVLTRGAAVAPLAILDESLLEQQLARVAAAAEAEPRDAEVIAEGTAYRVVAAEPGRSVDLQAGIEQAIAALSRPDAADMRIAVEARPVPPAVATEAAEAAVERYQNVAGRAVALAGGGVSSVVTPATLHGWVSLREEGPGNWTIAIDEAAIGSHVAGFAEAIDREPVDAQYEFGESGVSVVPAVTGQQLDVAATVQEVRGLLDTRAGGGQPTGANLVVALTEPDVTTATARELATRVVKISSWTTRFIPGESNFSGKNITIPAKLLDGVVIAPGERFSFLDAVGSFTADKGFGPGGAIIRGRTDPTGAMGGGICSTSTTLFNAALRGGYRINARTQHSYYIDRYPVGLDATVWRSGGSKRDMVFTNDSEYPLWIRGIGKKRQVTFEIWSVPDGRRVELSDPRIADRTKPTDTVEYTTALKPGERKRIEQPVAGFQSWVTRVVRDAQGGVLHEDTFYSRYITITGITQVGIAPGETPPADD